MVQVIIEPQNFLLS